MCPHIFSFYHELSFSLLFNATQLRIVKVFPVYKLQFSTIMATFDLVLYNCFFPFYGKMRSGLPVYKPSISEIYDPHNRD